MDTKCKVWSEHVIPSAIENIRTIVETLMWSEDKMLVM